MIQVSITGKVHPDDTETVKKSLGLLQRNFDAEGGFEFIEADQAVEYVRGTGVVHIGRGNQTVHWSFDYIYEFTSQAAAWQFMADFGRTTPKHGTVELLVEGGAKRYIKNAQLIPRLIPMGKAVRAHFEINGGEISLTS